MLTERQQVVVAATKILMQVYVCRTAAVPISGSFR
jgi:hypothetical protein